MRLIRIYSGAAAELHALDAFLSGAGRLTRAEEGVRDAAEGFGFAGGTGLKDSTVLVGVSRDVEGVALSVAKAVDYHATQTALLVDGLFERLRLAPVQAQIATLGDVQRLLAGLQNFVRGGSGPRPSRKKSGDGWLLASVRFVWIVLVRVQKCALKGVDVRAPQRVNQERQKRC